MQPNFRAVFCLDKDGTSKNSALVMKIKIATLPSMNANNMMFLTNNTEETLPRFADLDPSKHPKFVSPSSAQEIAAFVYNN